MSAEELPAGEPLRRVARVVMDVVAVCWVFLCSQINLQARRYHCSFHPGVFRGIISTEEHVYIIEGLGSSKDTTLDRGKDREDF
jgi:hypothetical protein